VSREGEDPEAGAPISRRGILLAGTAGGAMLGVLGSAQAAAPEGPTGARKTERLVRVTSGVDAAHSDVVADTAAALRRHAATMTAHVEAT